MTENELNPQANRDDGSGDSNLSLFEEAMSDIDTDRLPPDPSSPQGNEHETIRSVISRLEKELGMEAQLFNSDDLTAPQALNNRLDALISLIGELPLAVTDAIQLNNVTDEVAQNIRERILDERMLKFSDEIKVSKILIHLYRLIEVIVVDPQQLFIQNLASQSNLLRALQSAASELEMWLWNKPERDAKQVQAKEFLQNELEAWYTRMKDVAGNSSRFTTVVEPIYKETKSIISYLDDKTLESQAYLNRIVYTLRRVVRSDLGNLDALELDQQTINDLRILMKDLS